MHASDPWHPTTAEALTKMNHFRTLTSAGLSLAMLATFAPIARADTVIDLERNRVVPVTLNENLSVRKSHQGDRISATVENDYDLPEGTELLGRVASVKRQNGDEPPYIAVTFDTLRLPDGSRQPIKAEPISMEGGLVKRDSRGRLMATRKVIRRDQAVLGGAVAGLVIGSILKKPFEGAVLGAVAGIIVGEDQKSLQENATLPKGTRMGALFDSPVHVAYNGSDWRARGYDDRYDDQYNDRDARRDDGYNTRNDHPVWRRVGGSESTSDRDFNITYRGRPLTFSERARPYRIGRTIMVPLVRTADQMDLTVDTDGPEGTLFVEGNDSRLRLEQGSSDYRLNGRSGTLTQAVSVRNGVTYVPLEILARMTDDPVREGGN